MASVSVPPAGASGALDRERLGLGILLVGGPLLLLGAAIRNPPHGIENDQAVAEVDAVATAAPVAS